MEQFLSFVDSNSASNGRICSLCDGKGHVLPGKSIIILRDIVQ